MNPIQVLLPQVANQIAAGEVVERPASIVKELVENSIDAGATVINIDIADGGKELIRIRDNGSGIPKDQLDLALAPHATSKLRAIDDLDSLISYGFRGEALASISSVSKLTLTSRTAQDVAGWQIYNEGKEYRTKSEPVAHNKGTTINVAELFYNTPARKKFLKSATVEFNYIEDLVRRMAIVRPNVEWTLSHNGKQKFRFKGLAPNQFSQRIQQVHPRSFTEDTISIKAQTKTFDMKMELVIEPFNGMNTKTNCIQYSYINQRMIKDKVIISAMKQALSELFNFVNYNYVLFLTIDPHAVDINVHPAKAEVRFVDAHKVHSFIFQNVFLQLSRQNGINSQFVENILLRTNLDSSLIDQQALEEFTAHQQRLPVPSSRLAGTEPESQVTSVNSSSLNLQEALSQLPKQPRVRDLIQSGVNKALVTNVSNIITPENEADEVEFEGMKSFTDPRLQQAAEAGELPSFNTQAQAKNYHASGFSFSTQPSYAECTGNTGSTCNLSSSFGFGSSNSQAIKNFGNDSSSNLGATFGGRAPQQGSSNDSLTSLLGADFLAKARNEFTLETLNSGSQNPDKPTNSDPASPIDSARETTFPRNATQAHSSFSPRGDDTVVSLDAQQLSTSLANFNQEFTSFAQSELNQDLNLDTISPLQQTTTETDLDFRDKLLLDSILAAEQLTLTAQAGTQDNHVLHTEPARETTLAATPDVVFTNTTTIETNTELQEITLSRAFIARDYLSHYLDLRQQQEFLFFLNQQLPATLSTANHVQAQQAQARLEAQLEQQFEDNLSLATNSPQAHTNLNSWNLSNWRSTPFAPVPAPSNAQLQQVIDTTSLAQQALSNGNARITAPQFLLDLHAVESFALAQFKEEILSCVTQRAQARSKLLSLAHTHTTLAGLPPQAGVDNPNCAWLEQELPEQLRVLSVVNSMVLLQNRDHVFLVAQSDLLELIHTLVHQQLEIFQASFAAQQLEARSENSPLSEVELKQAQTILNHLEILDLWCNSDMKKFALPEVYAYNLELFTRLGLFRHGDYLAQMLETKAQPLL